MVAATESARRCASSISEICPACSAPMVGTRASVPRRFSWPTARVNSSLVRTVCTPPEPPVNLLTGGACTRAGGKIKHGPAAFHRLRQRKGRHRQVDDGGPYRGRARSFGPSRRSTPPRQPPADHDSLFREPRRDHAAAREERPAERGL